MTGHTMQSSFGPLTKDASKGRKINRIITLDSGNDKKLKISDFASSKQG